MSLTSFFVDDDASAALAIRVPDAAFNSGMFGGGSNAPGIGISTTNPGLAEQLPNWTLLDQHGDARSSQISQHLGGPAISDAGTSSGLEGTLPDAIVRLVDTDTLDGTGELTFPALGADLTSLATGWEEGA